MIFLSIVCGEGRGPWRHLFDPDSQRSPAGRARVVAWDDIKADAAAGCRLVQRPADHPVARCLRRATLPSRRLGACSGRGTVCRRIRLVRVIETILFIFICHIFFNCLFGLKIKMLKLKKVVQEILLIKKVILLQCIKFESGKESQMEEQHPKSVFHKSKRVALCESVSTTSTHFLQTTAQIP